MADHPIIFSAPMIRALLEGRKTMTRRLAWREVRENQILSEAEMSALERKGWQPFDGADEYTDIGKPSPWQRVQPGDRLWVRENMRVATERQTLTYVADGAAVPKGSLAWQDWCAAYGAKTIPSIHMPRWASRLTLTVTAVRVERLQEISTDDAKAEGCGLRDGMQRLALRIAEFRVLWNSLHGPGAWDANPEVVAISFDLRKGNIDHGR